MILAELLSFLVPCSCGGKPEIVRSPMQGREVICCQQCRAEVFNFDAEACAAMWNGAMYKAPKEPAKPAPPGWETLLERAVIAFEKLVREEIGEPDLKPEVITPSDESREMMDYGEGRQRY